MSEHQPPEPPPSADETGGGAGSARPPLRRAKDDRILGGLAAGIARYFAIDVSIVRIVMVLLALFTQGLAILAYIAGV
ncbi:MAG: PspC domain-containing protein, partial [Nitriliruptoraceae bacterium]